MATVYSKTSTTTVSGKKKYERAYASYSVTTNADNTTVTVSGTLYFQVKGTLYAASPPAYTFARISVCNYAGGYHHSPVLFKYTDGVNTYASAKTYSAWTTLKSTTFSFTLNRDTEAYPIAIEVGFFEQDSSTKPSSAIYGSFENMTTATAPALESYAVTYDANGGTNAPNAQAKYYGKTLALSTAKPTRDNASFVKWSGSDGNDYQPGGTYTANAALTLTAVWISVPQITSLIAVRCSKSGSTYADDDEGTYARISCAWSIDPTIDAQASATVTGTIAPQGGTASAITIESGGSGTSGTAVAHPSNLDPDTQYSVTVTVTNGTQSTSRTVIITRAFFIMDFKAGGAGIGIGRAAPASGLEVGYDATFDDDVLMRERLTVARWAGVIQMFAGSTPPAGWLLCDGNYVSQAEYPALFAAIGYTWGAEDSVPTGYFALPDFRGRTPLGETDGRWLNTVYPNLIIDGYRLKYSTDSYLAYQLPLSENMTINTQYTIQLWDVTVVHSGKTAANTGVAVYWGGGSVKIAEWLGTDYFTPVANHTHGTTIEYYAPYLELVFTTGGSAGADPDMLNVYNSVPDASGQKYLRIGKFQLKKGSHSKAPYEPRPQYRNRMLGTAGGESAVKPSTDTQASHTHGKGTLAITASGSHHHNVKGYGNTVAKGSNYYRYGNSGTETATIGMSNETHTHPNANFSGNTGATGGGIAPDNMPPYAVVNFIIHTGKTS